MTTSQYAELIAALEDKPLGVALNRLASLATSYGHKSLAMWARYELDGYNEDIHKRNKDNQVPQYRNVTVLWRDIYNRPLSLQGIQIPELFRLLSQWTIRHGVLELESYIENGNGITIVPEQLHLLSEMVKFPMRGGDIAREALIGMFKKIRSEALRRLTQIELDEECRPSENGGSANAKPRMLIYKKSDRSELRQMLNNALKLDSSLDAFCLDYFPHIHRQFTGGMDRTTKLNLLLLENLEEIRHYLMCNYSDKTGVAGEE